jgi:hypothetical protein
MDKQLSGAVSHFPWTSDDTVYSARKEIPSMPLMTEGKHGKQEKRETNGCVDKKRIAMYRFPKYSR